MSPPGTPAGVRTVGIEIAQLGVRLTATPPELVLTVPSAVRGFVRSLPAPDIELSVDWMDEDTEARALTGSRLVFDSGKLWRLHRGPGPDADWIFQLASARFGRGAYRIARFGPEFDRGAIHVDRRSAYADGVYPLEYPLDELVWMHALARRQGACLHACGLVEATGSGYVFVGQSGAGKSTTARLWSAARPVTILSDDRIILRETDGACWLHGTPWHGDGIWARTERAPLSGIFLLTQAPCTELRRLAPARAVSRLLAASFLPFHDARAMSSAADLLTAAVLKVPCFELCFTPDASAVNVVARTGASQQMGGEPPC